MNRLTQTLIKAIPAEQRLQLEKQLAHKDLLISTLKKDLQTALKQATFLEKDKQVLLGMHDAKKLASWKRTKRIVDGEAAAMLLLSDIHVEEVVKAETVNNLNRYTPKIAAKRLENVVDRFCYMVNNQFRRTSDIQDCVLWLGGDLISGHIHDELIEGNAMSPINATIYVYRLLRNAIDYILKHGNFKKIVVVGSSGNHDRDTKKKHAAGRVAHSYSTLVYEFLRERFENEPRLEWNIAAGQFVYLDVLGRRIRFTHGDGGVKYQGGLAGLSAPLNRAVMRWDTSIPSDFTILGHFHCQQWCRPNSWLINGSLIGTSPYGLDFGYSDPCQSCVIVTKDRGVVSAVPIFTD
jgi:hypothetical protein